MSKLTWHRILYLIAYAIFTVVLMKVLDRKIDIISQALGFGFATFWDLIFCKVEFKDKYR